jgi:hypothetical protein
MSNYNRLRKLSVVASSLLLAIGFVSYQAGAFDSWSETGAEAIGAP